MIDATDITILLDRTGSMNIIRDDTIGGFNRFVTDQRALPGRAWLTLIQFDSQAPFEMVYLARTLSEAPLLTHETYQPRAMTPLLDAIGRTVIHTGNRLKAIPEADRPDKVLLVILTDGLENASQEFSKARIQEMLTHQQAVYKWSILFLGANMDAVHEGASLGNTNAAANLNYAATPSGIKHAYASMSRATASYRSGETAQAVFTADDQALTEAPPDPKA